MMLMLVGFSIGCAHSKNTSPENTVNIPEWYCNIPQEDGIVYGVGVGRSHNQQLARRKAVARATAEILEAAGCMITHPLETEIVKSDATDSTRVHSFIKSVSSQASAYITGVYVEQYFFANDGTCYVLASCPLSGIKEVAIEEMKSNEELLEELGLESSLQILTRAIQAMR